MFDIDNLNDDLDFGDLEEIGRDEYEGIFGDIGKALGSVAKVVAPIANFIPGVGPIVAGGLSAIGNAVTSSGAAPAPAPAEAIQGAIQSAANAAPGGLGAAVQAAMPGVGAALMGGVDPHTLIAALPDVVKDAVRTTMAQMKAGQLSDAQATRQITTSVGADVLPHLATAVAALREQKLQTQATMEHNAINARNRFKSEVRTKLDTLLARTGLTPAQALLRRSI